MLSPPASWCVVVGNLGTERSALGGRARVSGHIYFPCSWLGPRYLSVVLLLCVWLSGVVWMAPDKRLVAQYNKGEQQSGIGPRGRNRDSSVRGRN